MLNRKAMVMMIYSMENVEKDDFTRSLFII